MHCHLQTSTTLLHSWLWQWWDVTENEMRWVMYKYFRQIYFLQTPLISRGVKIGCTAFAISDQAPLISKAFGIYSAFFFFLTQQSSTNSWHIKKLAPSLDSAEKDLKAEGITRPFNWSLYPPKLKRASGKSQCELCIQTCWPFNKTAQDFFSLRLDLQKHTPESSHNPLFSKP